MDERPITERREVIREELRSLLMSKELLVILSLLAKACDGFGHFLSDHHLKKAPPETLEQVLDLLSDAAIQSLETVDQQLYPRQSPHDSGDVLSAARAFIHSMTNEKEPIAFQPELFIDLWRRLMNPPKPPGRKRSQVYDVVAERVSAGESLVAIVREVDPEAYTEDPEGTKKRYWNAVKRRLAAAEDDTPIDSAPV